MIDNKIKVGITHGDINGISYEVIIKTLSDNRMCEMMTPVIYGSTKVMGFHKKYITDCEPISLNQIKSADDIGYGRVNIINCCSEDVRVDLGQSTEAAGQAAFAALDLAIRDLKRGAIDVLVTAPINKKNIQSDSFNFSGHTEYLTAQFDKAEPLMIMTGDIMRVGLATIHIPLETVKNHITKENLVDKLRIFKRSLLEDFTVREPKIAVLSLNPHSGDSGLLGNEEADVIKPAILEANGKGVLCFGPFAADGFFGSGAFKKYDGVLAMYHDQGLIPFKALCTDSAVNFTAGLPIVRTSPAHGVGYDIAGQNIADESSFRASVYLALDVFRSRAVYKKISANPLQKQRVESGPDVSVRDLEEKEKI